MLPKRWFLSRFFKQKRVYLDYAAATPVAREVLVAMQPYFSGVFGNARAIHTEGREARQAVDKARGTVADILNIRSTDVIFTSGGTESNHLAILGVVEALHEGGRAYADMEVVSSRIEHPSLLGALDELTKRGVIIKHVVPDDEGLLQPSAVKAELSPRTVLVAFSYVNSEIGVIQNVKHITRTVRSYATACGKRILVHLDACQAPLWLPCQMDKLGVDLLALDAGKCYGPKGVGVLAKRHTTHLRAQLTGGGQEFGLRAGTENTPLIVGCACAIERAQRTWEKRSVRAIALRNSLFQKLQARIPHSLVNGSSRERVANNVNISIPGIDTEFAVVSLDVAGIAASTKSACASSSGTGSVVVREITGDEMRATSTVRFTLGESTTEKDIDRAVSVLSAHVEKMMSLSTRKASS